MGRPKRILFAGACYLISLRGNSRQDLFVSNQDRRFFLALLKEYKERHGLAVYAYQLQPAQVLLVLETSRPDLSTVMQGFNVRYSRFFNAAHGASGHVFHSRYKAWVVDKERRLAETTRYVHLTGLGEALKDKPWRCQWSSCAAYVEAENREPLVDTGPVLRGFGGGRLKQSVGYLHYLQERLSFSGEPVLPVAGGLAIGDGDFLAVLRARAAAPAEPAPAPLEAARRVVAEVAVRRGIPEEKIMGRLRWRAVSAARREAVHKAWKEAGLGVSELARLFSRTPSAISQMIRAREETLI